MEEFVWPREKWERLPKINQGKHLGAHARPYQLQVNKHVKPTKNHLYAPGIRGSWMPGKSEARMEEWARTQACYVRRA